MATNSADLLKRINTCRSLDELPVLVLAFGCEVTAGISSAYHGREAELVKNVQQYTSDARAISRCATLAEARAYLREHGYGYPYKPRTNWDIREDGVIHPAAASPSGQTKAGL